MKRAVIIYSTIKLFQGNSAGSARVMNYARSLSKNCLVYLISFQDSKNIDKNIREIEPNIFVADSYRTYKNRIIKKIIRPFEVVRFISDLNKFSKLQKKTSFLLYPSTEVLIDYLSILILKRIYRKKIFIEFNEVRKYSTFLFQDINLTREPYKYIRLKKLRLKYILSEKLLIYFDGAICISKNIERYIKKYNSNTIRIPILSDLSKLSKPKNIGFRENGVFKMGFFGSISYKKENFKVLFKALKQLKENESEIQFRLDLYGKINRETKSFVKDKIDFFNLKKNVFIQEFIEQEQVIDKMKDYHLLLLPRGNNNQNKYGLSTKLSEYLMSGVPVLVTNVSDNALYIKDNFNGFIIEPDSVDELMNKIITVIKEYNEKSEIVTKNAIDTVKNNFDYNLFSTKLCSFLC